MPETGSDSKICEEMSHFRPIFNLNLCQINITPFQKLQGRLANENSSAMEQNVMSLSQNVVKVVRMGYMIKMSDRQ